MIDGSAQPGCNLAHPPLIRVDGNDGNFDGIAGTTANCTVKALMVSWFSQAGSDSISTRSGVA